MWSPDVCYESSPAHGVLLGRHPSVHLSTTQLWPTSLVNGRRKKKLSRSACGSFFGLWTHLNGIHINSNTPRCHMRRSSAWRYHTWSQGGGSGMGQRFFSVSSCFIAERIAAWKHNSACFISCCLKEKKSFKGHRSLSQSATKCISGKRWIHLRKRGEGCWGGT